MKKKIVVVGNGMVGYKFCEKLINKDVAKQFEIIVFGEEIRPAYDRVHLSEYFAGKTVEDLTMEPISWTNFFAKYCNLKLLENIFGYKFITKLISHHAIPHDDNFLFHI